MVFIIHSRANLACHGKIDRKIGIFDSLRERGDLRQHLLKSKRFYNSMHIFPDMPIRAEELFEL